MLSQRLIFGPLMIAALVGLLYLDERLGAVATLQPGIVMFALFVVLILLGGRELVGIFRAKSIAADAWIVAIAGVTGCAAMYLTPPDFNSARSLATFATGAVLVLLLSLVRHTRRRRGAGDSRVEGAAAAGAATLFAFLYMGVLPGFYLLLRRDESVWVIAAMILTTKSCDTGAYFTGRAIGRHKLIPWLSPGKTWEGLVGGLVVSGAVGAGLAALLNRYGVVSPHLPLAPAAAVGVLLGLVGQFGDLTASLLKRDAGIKDSGNTIPGFGGILDVVDSPLIIAPFAYWVMQLPR